ncbi:MAG: DUF3352 domain-containing protein [Actinomycetota bacterium]|nr:DUF3352 domain-containing protein [Actinomycetota bacterium]
MKTKIVIGTVVTLLLVGAIGLLSYGFFFASSQDDALSLVPEDSIGYFNVFLSPSTSQKQALEDLIAKTPYENPEEAIDKLTSLVDEGLSEQGCTFEEDIDPWLGKQVAGFLSEAGDGAENEGEGAILVATDDADAALESLDECGDEVFQNAEDRTYEGTDYKFQEDGGAVGVVESHLVIGTENAFKDVVDTAANGDSLEGSEKYEQATEPLTGDRVATFYLDSKALFSQLQEAGGLAPQELVAFESIYGMASDQPFSAALTLRSDAIVFEYAAGLPQGEAAEDITSAAKASLTSDIVSQLPGGSWGAIGLGEFGQYIDKTLDLVSQFGPGGREFIEEQIERETGLSLSEDILSWMGDLGIFVQGTSPTTVSGGVVIETKDAEASRTAIAALEKLARREKAPVKDLGIPGVEGFAIQDPFQPQPINVVAGDERVVIAYGDLATQQALESSTTLQEDETFNTAEAALGDGFTLSGYFEANAIQTLVEDSVLPSITTLDPTTGQPIPNTDAQQTYDDDVKPFIDPLSFVAFGSRLDGDTTLARFIVGVE